MDVRRLRMPTRAWKTQDMETCTGSRKDERMCARKTQDMATCTGSRWDRFVAGRSGESKNSAICLRMDQSAEAIKRQNREGQHGENPYTKVKRGVPCLHESRETIKTRIEVEPRFPGSHESQGTINQTNKPGK